MRLINEENMDTKARINAEKVDTEMRLINEDKGNMDTKQPLGDISINDERNEVIEIPINDEQEKVIKTLEEVLKFLKSIQIKNEDSFSSIKKPLDDLMTSLKYLPVETSFDILPTEIKTRILSYTCDNGAFVVASVCQDWKEILLKRLKDITHINVGKHCTNINVSHCQDMKCFMAEELLKSSITLKLDIPLSLCCPVTDVDPELITKALTDVSDIRIDEECHCENWKLDKHFVYGRVITPPQLQQLIGGLERINKVMNSVELLNINLNHLDQDRLLDFFLNKTNKLLLTWVRDGAESMLDGNTFIRKLSRVNADLNLEYLSLNMSHVEHSDELSVDFADALCNVKNIRLSSVMTQSEAPIFELSTVSEKRLIENILTNDIRMETLSITLDWRNLISPQDLKYMINKMEGLRLSGLFSMRQIKVVRSIPNIEISDYTTVRRNLFLISKHSEQLYRHVTMC